VTTSYNCTSEEQRAEGLEHAQRAINEKKCVVMPTDTVYGIAADAFSPQAVTMLLVSKGRGRHMPPPVLIPRINALDGLATDVSEEARKLAEAFWPGGLTLIFHAQPSLDWDLGETRGTVALRMPDDSIALELLNRTGPLAVSSANRTGQAAAQTAAEARTQLAESVEVYLEGGFRPVEGTDSVPSTIVDATTLPLRVVRDGAVSLERLREVVPGVLALGETTPEAAAEPETETARETAADPATETARETAADPATETARETAADPQTEPETAPAVHAETPVPGETAVHTETKAE
jgi:tRNA threonylcarbamoyl adenosine modification protein (Sua5/YciO/YrdC/YwlC family)